jgi:hypothetical protein
MTSITWMSFLTFPKTSEVHKQLFLSTKIRPNEIEGVKDAEMILDPTLVNSNKIIITQ